MDVGTCRDGSLELNLIQNIAPSFLLPDSPPPPDMPCLPSCVIPCSSPTYGLGSCGMGGGMMGGCMGGGMGGVSSSSLGILPGAAVSCITQIPSSEVVVQPPSYVMTIPGPIMSASCEPLRVGGYSPCSSGGGMGGGMLGCYGGRQRSRCPC
ncbi:hypothetical protein lerEdw1_010663 [Lerista edwardsae]|nr:hypothetical protein lerEdw1_010663 [Lerista edwardsae]